MMSSNQLYIQGRKVEIPEGEVVALTKQVNEVANIDSRKTNLSNDIRVPYYKLNEKHINFAGVATSKSRYPYFFLPAYLVSEGIEVVRNGRAVIKQTQDDQATITLYWGNSDFFERLNFLITELDFTDLNHTFTNTAISTLYDDKEGKVFYSFNELGNGNIDFGLVFKTLFSASTYPSISVVSIIDKILNRIGYTLSGEILNSPDWSSLAIQLQGTTIQPLNLSDLFVESGFFLDGDTFLFAPIINDGGSPASFDNEKYVNKTSLQGAFSFRVFWDASYLFESGAIDEFLFFQFIRVRAVDGTEDLIFQDTIETQFTGGKIYNIATDLEADDYVYMKLIKQGSVDDSNLILGLNSNFRTTNIVTDSLVGECIVSDHIPEITARDLFRTLARIFGIVFVPGQGREIQLKTYKDLEKSKAQNIVYPHPVNVKTVSTSYNPGNYFQNSRVGYVEQKGEQTETVNINIGYLPDNGDLITIDSYLGQSINGLLRFDLFEDGDQNELPLILFNARVFDQAVLPGTWAVSDGSTNVNFTKVVRGDVNGINPQRIATDYYLPLFNIVRSYREVTIKTLINVQQFFEIDNYTAYYFPDLKRFAQIQKVSNFVSNQPTTLKLILL
ncbi:MAG: hypothetical protein EA392_02935 [Cryomorphaceae bacterium]|nr:MAG: hypothetical protein EA392_02935 [Cryomorphaceae bacterium]